MAFVKSFAGRAALLLTLMCCWPLLQAEETDRRVPTRAEPSPSLRELSRDQPALALDVYEPIYFVAGSGPGEDLKARFQLSFKYQLFDAQSAFVTRHPALQHLYFSYTQTSLWNWSQSSVPFEDTSYQPSVFYEWQSAPWMDRLTVGYRHESNGRDGLESRSMDLLFVQPGWLTRWLGRDLIFAPRLFVYLDSEVPVGDLADYRGYVDAILRYGNEDGLIVQALYRHGTDKHPGLQLDFSYPVRNPIGLRTGGFVFLQVFSGYGESLLNYNQTVDLTLRLGFGIVR